MKRIRGAARDRDAKARATIPPTASQRRGRQGRKQPGLRGVVIVVVVLGWSWGFSLHMLSALGDLGRVARAAEPDPTSVTADGAGGSGAAGVTADAGADAATAKRLAALRKKVLTDDDFIENDETNRDPFHSYLRLFADHGASKPHKVASAIFDHVGLEELTLIAIVSGTDSPRAMFRDATGFGQSVRAGDFLSRAGARVTKILSDRVIVELSEVRESGAPRTVERAILVNPGEAR